MEIPVPVQPSWLRRASAPLPGLSAPGRLFDQRFGEGLLEAELAALCPAALAPYLTRTTLGCWWDASRTTQLHMVSWITTLLQRLLKCSLDTDNFLQSITACRALLVSFLGVFLYVFLTLFLQ